MLGEASSRRQTGISGRHVNGAAAFVLPRKDGHDGFAFPSTLAVPAPISVSPSIPNYR